MFASLKGNALCRMPSHARCCNVQPTFRYPANGRFADPLESIHRNPCCRILTS